MFWWPHSWAWERTSLKLESIMKLLPMATLRVWLMVLAAMVLTACGGGGNSATGTAPVISGLLISPSAAYVSDTPQSFATEFDFTDPDGNLAFLTLRILNGSGVTVNLQTLPIVEAEGLTEGTILGTIVTSAVTPDTYTAQIYVTDASGQPSNTLVGSARIAAYPWSDKLAAPTPREYAASAVLDGKVYVMGGLLTTSDMVTNLVEVYDPVSNTWSAATPMPTARMGLVAAVMNGKIYAIGGKNELSPDGLHTVEEFVPGLVPGTGLWTTRNPMHTPRYFAAAALLGGEVHVTGGGFGVTLLNSMEAYNPLTNQWRNRAAMPTARSQLTMAEANGRLYAVGGYGGLVSQWLGAVEEYNPLTDLWANRAPLPTGRANLALVQINGKLLAAGGENMAPANALDVLQDYDPATNAWLTKTPSLTGFTRATASVVNGKMLVFGNRLALAYDPTNEIR
jgi:N-acetylneuraminic acid mutarotase